MELLLKAVLGAMIVIVIQLLAKTNSYYIAGLAPLFPTFALISHYIVGSQRALNELKTTILFGMFSLGPYFMYLLALYFLVDRLDLGWALFCAAGCWVLTAVILLIVWNRFDIMGLTTI
jgi:uncharacterized membrane protein (GlpM family)